VSRGPWKTKPAKDAERLIAMAESRGYIVTSVDVTNDGVRLGLRRPGERDTTIETADDLKQLV
jgi:hypothetical protein